MQPRENGQPQVQIGVADSGSGMSQAFIRDRLFRPFASTKKRGLGLGLYQCRSIVHVHGGELTVRSEEGVGTQFRVVLNAPKGDAGNEATKEQREEVSE